MPPLTTETIRLKEDQQIKLRLKYKGRSSFLFRELFDIFMNSDKPGMDILSLRKKLDGQPTNTSGARRAK